MMLCDKVMVNYVFDYLSLLGSFLFIMAVMEFFVIYGYLML